jgi:hypothetical protein
MEADTHYNETSSSRALPSMKILVAIAFILILGSLGSALFFLMRDKGKSNRTVQALALRVGFIWATSSRRAYIKLLLA